MITMIFIRGFSFQFCFCFCFIFIHDIYPIERVRVFTFFLSRLLFFTFFCLLSGAAILLEIIVSMFFSCLAYGLSFSLLPGICLFELFAVLVVFVFISF